MKRLDRPTLACRRGAVTRPASTASSKFIRLEGKVKHYKNMKNLM